MEPEASPDLIQPVIGFRRWNITGDGLRSLGLGSTVWEAGKNAAVCKGSPVQMERARLWWAIHTEPRLPASPPDHLAPDPACGCGLYALHELEVLRHASSGPTTATGAVAMWGELEVHGTGARAQFARIMALAWPHNLKSWKARRTFKRVANNYGVPVVALDDLEEEAYKHGIAVPKELIPAKPASITPTPLVYWSTSKNRSTSKIEVKPVEPWGGEGLRSLYSYYRLQSKAQE